MPPPPPPPPGPARPAQTLSQNFSNAARAALARTEEGQRIFYPIAAMWDDYMQTDAVRKLPAHLRKPLTRLCKEVTSIANEHFEAYIKGTYPSLARLGPPQAPTPPASTPPTTASPTASYASIAAANPPL